jgi:putative methionine-R-sulfoxide reductase with GAF domain
MEPQHESNGGANAGSIGGVASALRRNCGDAALYERLASSAAQFRGKAPADCLQPLTDLLWEALAPRGVSWIGFYLIDRETPLNAARREGAMLLAARRDKPACSPIGLHGVCGQGFLEESARLVEDVGLLGPSYIACDPRDRSELVLPIYRAGECWGVLDADSHEVACFGDGDVQGMTRVLLAAGLLDRTPPLRADRLQNGAVSL